MSQLACSYLGLKLNSPLIAASSPLTADIGHLKELERAGVGAVVLKSVFEEQIEAEADSSVANLNTGGFADADSYLSLTKRFASSSFLFRGFFVDRLSYIA